MVETTYYSEIIPLKNVTPGFIATFVATAKNYDSEVKNTFRFMSFDGKTGSVNLMG
jgi:hypothetical protein